MFLFARDCKISRFDIIKFLTLNISSDEIWIFIILLSIIGFVDTKKGINSLMFLSYPFLTNNNNLGSRQL